MLRFTKSLSKKKFREISSFSPQVPRTITRQSEWKFQLFYSHALDGKVLFRPSSQFFVISVLLIFSPIFILHFSVSSIVESLPPISQIYERHFLLSLLYVQVSPVPYFLMIFPFNWRLKKKITGYHTSSQSQVWSAPSDWSDTPLLVFLANIGIELFVLFVSKRRVVDDERETESVCVQ